MKLDYENHKNDCGKQLQIVQSNVDAYLTKHMGYNEFELMNRTFNVLDERIDFCVKFMMLDREFVFSHENRLPYPLGFIKWNHMSKLHSRFTDTYIHCLTEKEQNKFWGRLHNVSNPKHQVNEDTYEIPICEEC